jgi:betaine lipid synthase
VEGGNTIGNCSPAPSKAIKEAEETVPFQISEKQNGPQEMVIDVTPPFSSFHYHTNKVSTLVSWLKTE